ncbi:hypothetical protein [Methylocystis sp.]|uniref:hypothetical protein n=1 Tax=Methylocystis sp. TaxID=1911079 RepID=UPI0025EC5A99|nr:hypothetical protein [Methylocystis sp.]
MTPLVSLRQAFTDASLLGNVMGGETHEPMRSLLLAAAGEELTPNERAHFKALTGRERELLHPVDEMHVFAGRRSGKSSGIASLVVYVSALCDHSDRLSPGERGVALLIAADQKQAKIMLRYVEGIFEQSPALRKLIVGRTQLSLSLANGIEIEVKAADFRGLRGGSFVIAACDEICFFRSEDSANPDFEIIDAVRPGLVTTRGQLFTISSTYRKAGFAHSMYAKHYGEKGDPAILVANGPTRAFNSTVPQKVIDRAIERDPQSAASEWLGEWRSDISALLPAEVVEACIVAGRYEIPPLAGVRYVAWVDPSGGSSDDMTLAICHRERHTAVVDCIRVAHPPFSPDQVVGDFCTTLKSYGLYSVRGDRYAGEWPAERFRTYGVRYESATQSTSDNYRDCVPLYNAGRVELLDHPKLKYQLIALERRTSPGGRELISHPPGAHDDIACCVCGGLTLALGERSGFVVSDKMLELAGQMPAYVRRAGEIPPYMKRRITY